jgi:hypothetical protein
LPDKRGWTVADSGSSSLDQKSGNPTEIAGAPDGRFDLNYWFTDAVLHPKPSPVPEVPKPGKPLLSLPAACRAVLTAPNLHAAGSAAGDHRQTH